MTEVAYLPRLSSGAQRMRRYRLRRRLGHSCVTVELRGDEIAALISCGLLQMDQRDDRAAIAAARRNECLPVFAWLHRDEGAKR
jgi:hypothetical protein